MQYLATELELDLEDDTPDEELQELAQAQVSEWLNFESNDSGFVGGWSDWYQVGGRWADMPVLIYNDDNACSFLSALDEIDKRQLDQFNEYFAEFDFPTVNAVMTKYSNGEEVEYREIYEANVSSLSSALKIMRGYWNWDSGFFDTQDCTVKTAPLRKKLGIDKTQYRSVYCLVPVDFHF
ncbi:MAG: hypothetical protein EBR82_53075 [Caulobacteraceae bacterium]|nr:hypothetical protein [Caulobacteraceae bacterium]